MRPALAELEWCRSPAEFRRGELCIFGLPVMQAWEASYVETLACAAAANGGAVLEVGYGLGVATAAIQANPEVTSHVVLECHPDVARRCIATWRDAIAAQRLHVVVGLWQYITPALEGGAFDGVLFSRYTLPPVDSADRQLASFAKESYRLLRRGGTFVYAADQPLRLAASHRERLAAAGFSMDDLQEVVCRVDPPRDCGYWHASTLVAPILKKAMEP